MQLYSFRVQGLNPGISPVVLDMLVLCQLQGDACNNGTPGWEPCIQRQRVRFARDPADCWSITACAIHIKGPVQLPLCSRIRSLWSWPSCREACTHSPIVQAQSL